MKIINLIILLLCASLISCKKTTFKQDTRSFYIGASPYPPDFTINGKNLSYKFINTNCDIIAHHFDDGVPWQEALDKIDYPNLVTSDINFRISTTKVHRVYLALTPLAISRINIANYWSDDVKESIKNEWATKDINDSTVIKAYYNYCCYMIDLFNPQYFNYAIECNSRDWANTQFNKFEDFCSKIYPKLKQRYPKLPIFTSYMVSLDEIMLERAIKLNVYSDYIAVSSYPYLHIGSLSSGITEPKSIPSNWLSRYKDIDKSKRFAIVETGYIAEDLDLSVYGMTKMGKPEWQADYVQLLFEECNNRDTEFVIWFTPYDYDNGYNTALAVGQNVPLFKFWRDTGLYDGNGLERPSLKVWKKWFKAEYK